MNYRPSQVVYANGPEEENQDYDLPLMNRKFGPSLSIDIFKTLKVFAYCAYSYFFQHEYASKGRAMKVVFLSPLSLPFCRHCGKVFRNAETFQQHLGKKDEHPYCTRLKKSRTERSLTANNKGNTKQAPTLMISYLSDEKKRRMFDFIKEIRFPYHDIKNMNPPLRLQLKGMAIPARIFVSGLKQRSQAEHDYKNTDTVSQVINPRAVVFSDYDIDNPKKKRKFGNGRHSASGGSRAAASAGSSQRTRDPRDQGRPPSSFPDNFPVNFVLKTEGIHVPKMEEWKKSVWTDENPPNKICLVACDETTAFGCLLCGSISAGGANNRKCVARCFGSPDTSRWAQQRVDYSGDWRLYHDSQQLKAEFEDTPVLPVLRNYVTCSGFQKKFWRDFTQNKAGPPSSEFDDPTDAEMLELIPASHDVFEYDTDSDDGSHSSQLSENEQHYWLDYMPTHTGSMSSHKGKK